MDVSVYQENNFPYQDAVKFDLKHYMFHANRKISRTETERRRDHRRAVGKEMREIYYGRNISAVDSPLTAPEAALSSSCTSTLAQKRALSVQPVLTARQIDVVITSLKRSSGTTLKSECAPYLLLSASNTLRCALATNLPV